MTYLRTPLHLDGFDRPLGPEEALTQRLQMVLDTRPGQVPWRPDFGCDLEGLVGEPATSQNLRRAQQLVEGALQNWMPDVDVVSVDVTFVPLQGGFGSRHPTVPLAEAALLALGVQVALEVQVEVRIPRGTAVLTASVNP